MFFLFSPIFLSLFFIFYPQDGWTKHGSHTSFEKGLRYEKPAYAAIAMDAISGEIIAQKNATNLVKPASLTKMLTLYILFQDLKNGRLSLNTPFKVSPYASKRPPTIWGVRAHQKISVKECILALSVRSANDIACVVHENIPDCMGRMNRTAQSLGMTRSVFCNTSGWDAPGQHTCAKDMALLVRSLYLHFPEYVKFLSFSSIKRGKNIIFNTNKLQSKVQGMAMGKTGFTSKAGYCLATLTRRNGDDIIVVVMGMPSSALRNQHLAKLVETYYHNPLHLGSLILSPHQAVQASPHRLNRVMASKDVIKDIIKKYTSSQGKNTQGFMVCDKTPHKTKPLIKAVLLYKGYKNSKGKALPLSHLHKNSPRSRLRFADIKKYRSKKKGLIKNKKIHNPLMSRKKITAIGVKRKGLS